MLKSWRAQWLWWSEVNTSLSILPKLVFPIIFDTQFWLNPIVSEIISESILAQDRLYILRGPRQVGKTTILKKLIKNLITSDGANPRSIFYFAFDIASLRNAAEVKNAIISYLNWAGSLPVQRDRLWIMLDEVTYTPDWAVGLSRRHPDKKRRTHHVENTPADHGYWFTQYGRGLCQDLGGIVCSVPIAPGTVPGWFGNFFSETQEDLLHRPISIPLPVCLRGKKTWSETPNYDRLPATRKGNPANS